MARIARIVMYVHDLNTDTSITNRIENMINKDSCLRLDSISSEEKEFDWEADQVINRQCDEMEVAKFYRELS